MRFHGSELVAVAQGLVEYRDTHGGFSRLYDTISKIRARQCTRGMSRATRELLGPSTCDRQVFHQLPHERTSPPLYLVCREQSRDPCACTNRGRVLSELALGAGGMRGSEAVAMCVL